MSRQIRRSKVLQSSPNVQYGTLEVRKCKCGRIFVIDFLNSKKYNICCGCRYITYKTSQTNKPPTMHNKPS